MRRYLRSSAVNDPVSAWGLYKSDDDQTHSDDLCCRWRLARREPRLRWRSRAIRSPPGAVYSTAPPPYPPGGYPADYRRGPGAPDFDALEDDEGPNAQSSTALPPPGPVLSPDDPRYGRPMGAPPVYSDRGVPTGPVLSPDDPRYGRPMGAPPVYSDRACRPVRSCRRMIRVMAVPMGRRR